MQLVDEFYLDLLASLNLIAENKPGQIVVMHLGGGG